MFINEIVLKSLKNAMISAKERSAGKPEPRKVENKRRSAEFVECLAGELRNYYQEEDRYRVLSKQYPGENQYEFGLNELLYDILVCKIDHVNAVRKTDAELVFIKEGIWAIESEMAKNTREMLYDFNKLLVSSSRSKLFVGPLTSYNDEVLALLSNTAKDSLCNGAFYFTLIPHPDDWEKIEAFNQEKSAIENLSLDDLVIKKELYTGTA